MMTRTVYPKKNEVYETSDGSRHIVLAVAVYERSKQSLIVLEDMETGRAAIVSPADFSMEVTRSIKQPDGSKIIEQGPAYNLIGEWVQEPEVPVEQDQEVIPQKVLVLKEGSGF